MNQNYTIDLLAPRRSLGYLVHRASKLSMATAHAAFADAEISFTQWIMLALLVNGTATTAAELSRHMGHNSGAMTRRVDQLQEKGLVCRRPMQGDRRATRLEITATGRETVAVLAARVQGLWNRILDGFTAEQVADLISTLALIVGRLEAMTGLDVIAGQGDSE